jgi:spermidine synthase
MRSLSFSIRAAQVPKQAAPPLHRLGASPARAAVALCISFAASGCAALIYQVVWFQLLGFSIGASAVSTGVVLATFLGGMCVGSLCLARVAADSRLPHALFLYAGIELAIGAFGLLELYALPAAGRVYLTWADGGTVDIVLRVAVAALCMLPPTMLMGATLPIVAHWVDGRRAGRAYLGLLYAANIAGGVLGSVLAGFYLLRVHDAAVATLAAAALNAAAAAVGFTLASRTRSDAQQALAIGMPDAPPRILVVIALSGMTALSAEVLWTRHLSLRLGGTVYTFALIVAVLLLGLGIGSAAGAVVGLRAHASRALGLCQLLLCAAIAWTAHTIGRSLPFWPIDVAVPIPQVTALQLDIVRIAWAILPAAILWGASFPLALAATGGDPRSSVARLYAANTAGAIAGALLTTFVLVVTVGSQRAQQLMILAAACAGMLLLLAREALPNLAHRTAIRMGVLLAALALAYTVPELPPAFVAYGRFLPTRGMDANVVYVGEGLTASIAVTREPSGVLTYHNAGKTQASTYPQDLRLQRMLGHLTTLVPEHPASVLVIGLGAGITAGAVSLDPAVERMVVAEIEPLVVAAAERFFAGPNFGVVQNAKVELRIDDGRHYLATARDKFDAITSDPLDTWAKGAAALYTREFWELCKSRLNPGGVVTVFLQLYETSDEAVKSEIATFLEAFPNGAIFANTVQGRGYDAVLLGRADNSPIDIERVHGRLASAAYEPVARSLREVGFNETLDLLATYVARSDDLAEWLRGAPINTDRTLRLQYIAAEGLNVFRADEIFRSLVGQGPSFPAQLFSGTPAQMEELRQRITARQGQF